MLNDVSSLRRVHNCGWAESAGAGSAGPQIAAADGVAYWRGVQRCGSIWACPVCSAKIRNARAAEISEFTAEWIRRGNECYMVTLTFPHAFGMALAALMLVISAAFRSLLSGRAWAGTPERPSKRGGVLPARPGLRDRLGIAGTIRALEVTHGPNGFHPHAHVLVYVRGALDARGLADLHVHVRDRWRKFITGKGYRAPSDAHGVKIERCYSGAGAAEYICKTQDGADPGNELARSDLKTGKGGHRTPFEILGGFAATGDRADLKLWHEYEKATFGRQAITWSPVLRRLQREWLAAEEKSDEELAAEDAGGEPVADVSRGAMRLARDVPGLRSGLLDAWEDGGISGLKALAECHGLMLVPGRDGCPPKLYRARKPAATGSP